MEPKFSGALSSPRGHPSHFWVSLSCLSLDPPLSTPTSLALAHPPWDQVTYLGSSHFPATALGPHPSWVTSAVMGSISAPPGRRPHSGPVRMPDKCHPHLKNEELRPGGEEPGQVLGFVLSCQGSGSPSIAWGQSVEHNQGQNFCLGGSWGPAAEEAGRKSWSHSS